MTFHFRIWAAAAFLAGLCSTPAWCDEPAALVEEISPDVQGVSPYDYVSVGSEIDLGTKGRITLGYLAGCVEEMVEGGRLTVGNKGSIVTGGHLSRQAVPCPTPVRPTAAESGQSGAMVFRAPPVVSISATYPIITVPAPGRVIIKPITGHEDPISLEADGHVIDLASKGLRLRLNGAYRIEYAGRQVVVRVTTKATDSAPLFARLIRF
jgi:hypothetical protein